MYQQKLHVVVDPLCGWTWAAAPLLQAAQCIEALQIEIHGGGMITGNRTHAITPQWREYALQNDRKIAAMTGQPFSEVYSDQLLCDSSVILDSIPATTALLAATELKASGVDVLRELQYSWFVHGENITQFPVLKAVAVRLGLETELFTETYQQQQGEPVETYIRYSRQLLENMQGQGFPSAALISDDRVVTLPISSFYGDPDGWHSMLVNQLRASN